MSSLKRLREFLKDGGNFSLEKAKVAALIYLTHLIYIKEQELDDLCRRDRNKIIETLKKKVEEDLSVVKNSCYFSQVAVNTHIKTSKKVALS